MGVCGCVCVSVCVGVCVCVCVAVGVSVYKGGCTHVRACGSGIPIHPATTRSWIPAERGATTGGGFKSHAVCVCVFVCVCV